MKCTKNIKALHVKYKDRQTHTGHQISPTLALIGKMLDKLYRTGFICKTVNNNLIIIELFCVRGGLPRGDVASHWVICVGVCVLKQYLASTEIRNTTDENTVNI